MAQKSKLNLKKILEYIGFVEEVDDEASVSRPSRVSSAAYEEERFTPAKKPAPAAGTAGARHAGSERAKRPAHDARARRETPGRSARPRSTGREVAARTAPAGRDMPAGTSTMVYYMHSLNECSNVIRDLIGGYSILLNLEETDSAQMQRIVDTLAGASFALGAVIRKVSEKTYIIAPRNVNVMTSDRYERRY